VCGSEFKDSQLSREALKNQLAEHVAETVTLKSELSKAQKAIKNHKDMKSSLKAAEEQAAALEQQLEESRVLLYQSQRETNQHTRREV